MYVLIVSVVVDEVGGRRMGGRGEGCLERCGFIVVSRCERQVRRERRRSTHCCISREVG